MHGRISRPPNAIKSELSHGPWHRSRSKQTCRSATTVDATFVRMLLLLDGGLDCVCLDCCSITKMHHARCRTRTVQGRVPLLFVYVYLVRILAAAFRGSGVRDLKGLFEPLLEST